MELYLQSSADGVFRAWLAQTLLCMIANISSCTDNALDSFKYPHPATLEGLFFDSTRWWPRLAFPVRLSVFDHLPWDEGPGDHSIEVLEKIGESAHWTFEVPKSEVAWPRQLARIAKVCPRPGLLRILSKLVAHRPDLAKSLPRVSPAGVRVPQLQAAMAVICLAQSDWDKKEAAGLAGTLAKSHVVDRHLTVLAGQQGHASQRFLLELLRGLPQETWDTREKVVQVLPQYSEA